MFNHAFSVGILADDLTSAADASAPFVARGLRAMVGRRALPPQTGEVSAVDSGSRSLPQAAAGRRVADLTANLAACPVLLKTVDSTLRGHVAIELAAAFKASGRERLVFAPAFPAAGRTTAGGIQLVDGQPVNETIYGRDPVHPARLARLREFVLPFIDKTILLDASSQDELDAKIADVADPETVLWAGSPGLAAALAKRFVPLPRSPAKTTLDCSEVLVAIGSANPRSRRQADRVAAISGLHLLRAPIERCPDANAVRNEIAREAAARIGEGGIGGVIATGGDTMEAILDALKIASFAVLGELEPGLPFGKATMPDGRSLLLAMKAGGFGDDSTLERAVAYLRSPSFPTGAAQP